MTWAPIICKYPIHPPSSVSSGRITIKMPRGAKALSVQTVRGQPVLYALVDAESTDIIDTEFYVVATGGRMTSHGIYLGTFQFDDGALVFHVFG